MSILAALLEKWKLVSLILILLIAAQMIFIRPRWQFYPLYLLAALFLIIALLNHNSVIEPGRAASRWILGLFILLLVLSMAFILIFPKEKIPVPTGEHPVGTRIYELDTEREELYTDDKNDHRRIKYQIWYPAERTEGLTKAKWISDGATLTRQLARSFHLPSFVLDHTAEIYSNSYIDAPVSGSLPMYPVVIISHGWQGFRELHTDFAEELASHGFIAVSIDHTYGSQAVTFEDGSTAFLEPSALPSDSDTGFGSSSSLLVRTYGEDVGSVLDDLEKKNTEDTLIRGKLDLSRTGIMGHSTGGGGSVYISIKDTRIRALMGLDAWVAPVDNALLGEGLDIPSLFLRSEQWSRGPNNYSLDTLRRSSQDSSLVQMKRTTHIDFTMAYMYSPLTKYIGFSGNTERRKPSEIQRAAALDFFDHHLRGSSPGSSDYLERIAEKYEDFVPVE